MHERGFRGHGGGNYGARDVSLELNSGVIGLLGPNGAEKTTLMQMIATITRPTSGRIFFHGVHAVIVAQVAHRRSLARA